MRVLEMMKKRKSSESEKGSVMMEYLILNLLLFAALAGSVRFFTPGHSGEVNLGDAFVQHYNLVLDIVSMPYP